MFNINIHVYLDNMLLYDMLQAEVNENYVRGNMEQSIMELRQSCFSSVYNGVLWLRTVYKLSLRHGWSQTVCPCPLPPPPSSCSTTLTLWSCSWWCCRILVISCITLHLCLGSECWLWWRYSLFYSSPKPLFFSWQYLGVFHCDCVLGVIDVETSEVVEVGLLCSPNLALSDLSVFPT